MKLKQIDFKKILVWVSIPVLFWGGIITLSVQSCTNSTAAPVKEQASQPTVTRALSFRLPEIPDSLTTPQERADYLSLHYWDNYNFQDTTGVASLEKTEQILSDYIAILPHVSEPMVQASVFELLSQAEKGKRTFLFFAELLEKYLYDPNSPFRNEEYYLHTLRFIEASPALDKIEKTRFAYQLQSVLKNRKGTKAADFTYTLADGRTGTLYGLKADYTLVYFNNPDCGNCKRTKEVLQTAEPVTGLVQAGKMRILAIYTDEDPALWKAGLSALPAGWFNARDGSKELTVKNKLYDIRAIPSLYLLDKDKQVLLKDATVEQVAEALGRI